MAVAWCFQDEATAFTDHVLDLVTSGAIIRAPAMWPLEVANAMLVAERRKRISAAQVTNFLRSIESFAISLDATPIAVAFDRILSIARQQGLAEYDASYLELAMRESLAIATLDEGLLRAARAVGAEILHK